MNRNPGWSPASILEAQSWVAMYCHVVLTFLLRLLTPSVLHSFHFPCLSLSVFLLFEATKARAQTQRALLLLLLSSSMAASDHRTTKSVEVDSSLWLDSFSLLLTDLENLPPSSDLPPSLVLSLSLSH